MSGSCWTTTISLRMLCKGLLGTAAAHHSAPLIWATRAGRLETRIGVGQVVPPACRRSTSAVSVGVRRPRGHGSSAVPLFPRRPCPNRSDQKTRALVVGWVEPQHPVEDAFYLVEATETPATQPEVMQAAQEWPVINEAPRQHAVEVVAQGQLADAKSHLVVTNGLGRPMLEDEVAQVRMRIQATKIGFAESHQDLEGVAWVAAVFEAWAKPIIARGPRQEFEMEQMLPGADPEPTDLDLSGLIDLVVLSVKDKAARCEECLERVRLCAFEIVPTFAVIAVESPTMRDERRT